MSKMIVKPMGEIVRRIVIEADVNGTVQVTGVVMEWEVKRGFRPAKVEKPMDVREMVLALIKVVQDYTIVLFATMGEGIIKDHGQENKNDNNSGESG